MRAKHASVIRRSIECPAAKPLDRVHTDFAGPLPVKSLDQEEYVLTFTDEYTYRLWAYLLRNQTAPYATFEEWWARVELEWERKVKAFHSDNGPKCLTLAKEL
jgi:hypothetical protein